MTSKCKKKISLFISLCTAAALTITSSASAADLYGLPNGTGGSTEGVDYTTDKTQAASQDANYVINSQVQDVGSSFGGIWESKGSDGSCGGSG